MVLIVAESFWQDPLLFEGIAAVVIFTIILLSFRKARGIADELERRKALSEYVRGLDEFLRGDYREAITTLEKVLERDPENVEARIALGDCYRERGDAAEAKKHHHHVHKVFGHAMARNFLSLGNDELALENYDLAVDAFERCLQLSRREPDALAGLAQAYAEGGNPVEAARFLRRLYPKGPAKDLGLKGRREAAKRFAEAGDALLDDGDAEGAVKMFTEALAFHRTSIRARTGLVRAAHALGDGDRARSLVAEHVDALKQLASDEEVLFEPAPARPAAEQVANEAEATRSFLPAKVEEVGGVVAAIEQRTARYACATCASLLRDYADKCPACGAVGTVEALDELKTIYTMPVADFHAAVDEVEENPAYIVAVAHKASEGDDEALQRLVGKGAGVLYEIFSALPAIEARRYLGSRMAALGVAAAREVQRCHAARGNGTTAQPHDEFAAGYYLSLPEADAENCATSLGAAFNSAVAGVLADPRLDAKVRDLAQRLLAGRGPEAADEVVQAVAASGDRGGIVRGAALVREWGDAAVDHLEKRFFQATLLGRIFRRTGARRRATADILARSGLASARSALARAAAREKDGELRSHYIAAKERAERGRKS